MKHQPLFLLQLLTQRPVRIYHPGFTEEEKPFFFAKQRATLSFSIGLCCAGPTSREPGTNVESSISMESTTSPGLQSGPAEVGLYCNQRLKIW